MKVDSTELIQEQKSGSKNDKRDPEMNVGCDRTQKIVPRPLLSRACWHDVLEPDVLDQDALEIVADTVCHLRDGQSESQPP